MNSKHRNRGPRPSVTMSSGYAAGLIRRAAAYTVDKVSDVAGAAVGASPLLQSAVSTATGVAQRVLANPTVRRTVKGVAGRLLGKHDFALAARTPCVLSIPSRPHAAFI